MLLKLCLSLAEVFLLLLLLLLVGLFLLRQISGELLVELILLLDVSLEVFGLLLALAKLARQLLDLLLLLLFHDRLLTDMRCLLCFELHDFLLLLSELLFDFLELTFDAWAGRATLALLVCGALGACL